MLYTSRIVVAVLALPAFIAVIASPTPIPRSASASQPGDVHVPIPWNQQMRALASWERKPIANMMACKKSGGSSKDISWHVTGPGNWARADAGRTFYRMLQYHCGPVIGYKATISPKENKEQNSTIAFDLVPGLLSGRSLRQTCVSDAFVSLAYFTGGMSSRWEVEDCPESKLEKMSKEQLELLVSETFNDQTEIMEDPARLDAPPMRFEDVDAPFEVEQGMICIKNKNLDLIKNTQWNVLTWGPWIAADHGKGFLDNLRVCSWKYSIQGWGFDYHFDAGAPYAVGLASFQMNAHILDWFGIKVTGPLQSGGCIHKAAIEASKAYGPLFFHCEPYGYNLGASPIDPKSK